MATPHDCFGCGPQGPDGPPTRRQALGLGLKGAAGLLAARLMASQVQADDPDDDEEAKPETPAGPVKPARAGKAKAVIQVWLWGGPSHVDTFDPKPEAGKDICGPLNQPLETNVKGIRIGQLLPQLAKVANLYTLVRTMTHGNNGHETAAYLLQTGRDPGERLVYPCVGAVVSLFKGVNAGYKGMIPPYVVLTQPQGRFSEAGFLGPRYKPFATGGDPGAGRFVVEGIVSPHLTDQQQEERRRLLGEMNMLGQVMKKDPTLEAMTKTRDEAYDLILGDSGRVFDLNTEKDTLRTSYGRSTFGQSCLMARRLVEKGVPYVTINHGGWDTHRLHFEEMRRKLPELDRGLATLLTDLKDHGLLDSTIVWCCGEFGRTPRVAWEAPWNGGRHHFGQVFSVFLAGGGFNGGTVVGTTDATAESVKDRPVTPGDFMGSLYEQLGIDPEGQLPHPQGLEVRITPPPGDGPKGGGRLKEVM